MSIKLRLYYIIENNFEEFLSYDNVLKLILIEGDIEEYGREKFKKSIDRAETVSANALKKLLFDFSVISKTDKERLKKVYFDFIDRAYKPDKKNALQNRNEDDEKFAENYSASDEHKAILEQERTKEYSAEEFDYLDEKSMELDSLTKDANLSDIEKHALEFLKSERKEKHTLLNNFTLNGIIQIANRGAYKLYYLNRTGNY